MGVLLQFYVVLRYDDQEVSGNGLVTLRPPWGYTLSSVCGWIAITRVLATLLPLLCRHSVDYVDTAVLQRVNQRAFHNIHVSSGEVADKAKWTTSTEHTRRTRYRQFGRLRASAV